MARSGSWVSGQTWEWGKRQEKYSCCDCDLAGPFGMPEGDIWSLEPLFSSHLSWHSCSAHSDAHLQAEAGQHLISRQDIVHGTALLPATRCGSPRGKLPPAGSPRGICSQGTLSQQTAYNTDMASREWGGGQRPGRGSGNGVHTHHGHHTPWPTGAMAMVVVEPECVAVLYCSPLHLHNHLLLPWGDPQPGHCVRGSSSHPVPGTACPAPWHGAQHPQGHSHPWCPLPGSPQGMQTEAG